MGGKNRNQKAEVSDILYTNDSSSSKLQGSRRQKAEARDALKCLELFAENFWIIQVTRTSFDFWRFYCRDLGERELELESLLSKDKITLLRICAFTLKMIALQSLNTLFQTCFWRWQGQANVCLKLAENDGIWNWDSDDSAFDDDAKTVALFGNDQYAKLKVLSDFILMIASPNKFV